MLLIEVDGKRILHTGDFKRSGIGVELFDQISKIGRVDFVITEGTMLNRRQTVSSEKDVCRQMTEIARKYKYVFVLTSSLNADRLASALKCASNCKKPVTVCSSMMMSAFKSYMNDFSEIFNVKPTYYPFDYSGNIDPKTRGKMKRFESWVRLRGFVKCVGIGQFEKVRDLLTAYNPSKCALIYSMWKGYYTIPEQVRINPAYKAFRELFSNVFDIHASGHADRNNLGEMLMLLNPTEGIIGIHKEAGSTLTSLDISDELKCKIIPDSYVSDCVTIK